MLWIANPAFEFPKSAQKSDRLIIKELEMGKGTSSTLFCTLFTFKPLFSIYAKKIIAIVIWFEKVLVYLFSPALALSSCTKGNHENWLRMNEINWITIIWLCCEISLGWLHSNCVSTRWQLFALVTQQRPSYYGHHSNLIMSSCCLWSFDSE